MSVPPDVVFLFRVLADEHRIKVAAQIMDGPRSVEEIARSSGLSPKVVGRHVGTLVAVGLASSEGDPTSPRFRFQRGPLVETLRAISQRPPNASPGGDEDDFDRKVLATFLVDGRLVSIPAQQKKREVILRFLSAQFETDRMYGEREVNDIIRRYHDDTASLRRYMVDGGFLNRQIVRVASMEALVEGNPRIDHHISYWRPSGEESV